MAQVICKFCNGKAFKDGEAYRQHARDSKTHHLKERQAQSQSSASSGESSQWIVSVAAPTMAHTTTRPGTPSTTTSIKAEKAMPRRCDSKDEVHIKSGICPDHPQCLRCKERFGNHAALDEHRLKAHPMLFCTPCQRYIYVADFIEHRKTTPIHQAEDRAITTPPTIRCPVCTDAFKDDDTCDRHIFALHPHMCCYTCGLVFHEEDQLTSHYNTAMMHPKCFACNLGFRDNIAHKAHLTAIHESPGAGSLYEVSVAGVLEPSSSRVQCPLCPLSFTSASLMEHHHRITHRTAPSSTRTPPQPIFCAECNRSFVHIFGYSQHMAAKHPMTPPIDPVALAQSDHNKTVSMALMKITETIISPGAASATTRTATSTPVCQTPKSETALTPRHIGIEIPEVTPQLLRAASEPPPSAVVRGGQSDITGEVNSGRVSPSIVWTSERSIISQPRSSRFGGSERSTDTRPVSPHGTHTPSADETYSQTSQRSRPSLSSHGTRLEAEEESPSPWSNASSPSTKYYSVPQPPPSEPEDTSHQPPSLSTTTAPGRSYGYEPTGNSPASESSSGLASPVSAHSMLFTLAASIQAARTAAAAQTRQSEGEAATAPVEHAGMALQSPPSPIAPLAPVEATPVREAVSAGMQPSEGHCGEASRSAYAEQASSPTRAPSSSRAGERAELQDTTPPRKALSWHCRSCLSVPHEPTVTMCGHLFCKSCIVAEIVKNYSCPVCRTVMLVRLDVALN